MWRYSSQFLRSLLPRTSPKWDHGIMGSMANPAHFSTGLLCHFPWCWLSCSPQHHSTSWGCVSFPFPPLALAGFCLLASGRRVTLSRLPDVYFQVQRNTGICRGRSTCLLTPRERKDTVGIHLPKGGIVYSGVMSRLKRIWKQSPHRLCFGTTPRETLCLWETDKWVRASLSLLVS